MLRHCFFNLQTETEVVYMQTIVSRTRQWLFLVVEHFDKHISNNYTDVFFIPLVNQLFRLREIAQWESEDRQTGKATRCTGVACARFIGS